MAASFWTVTCQNGCYLSKGHWQHSCVQRWCFCGKHHVGIFICQTSRNLSPSQRWRHKSSLEESSFQVLTAKEGHQNRPDGGCMSSPSFHEYRKQQGHFSKHWIKCWLENKAILGIPSFLLLTMDLKRLPMKEVKSYGLQGKCQLLKQCITVD